MIYIPKKTTDRRILGPIDPKVHSSVIENIAKTVSDSTQQQRRQDLNRISGYPKYSHPDPKSFKWGVNHYNPMNNSIWGDQPVAEETHAYQNKEGGMVSGMIKDWVNHPYFSKKGYGKLYAKPDTKEYDAHSRIQPIFQRFIKGGITEDQIKPSIEILRGVSPGTELFSLPYSEKDDKNTIYNLQEGLSKKGYLNDSVKSKEGVFEGNYNKETIAGLKKYRLDNNLNK